MSWSLKRFVAGFNSTSGNSISPISDQDILHEMSQGGSRRGGASDRGRLTKAAMSALRLPNSPRCTMDTSPQIPPTQVRASPRGSLKNKASKPSPISFIFPAIYDRHHMESTTAPTPQLLRSNSLLSHITEKHLQTLHALFTTCDLDEDGIITENELAMLLQLIGEPTKEAVIIAAQTWIAKSDIDEGTTFDKFTRICRAVIMAHPPENLPRADFVVRCKRLKRGYQKCDGDGSNCIKRTELEIAMQKLDLIPSDDELNQIFSILDRDNDGVIEWTDFIYSLWKSTLSDISLEMREYFTIDMFADLPTLIRPATSGNISPTTVRPMTPMTTSPSPLDVRNSMSAMIPRISLVRPRTSFVESSLEKPRAGAPTVESRSTIERMGIEYLTRFSMHHLSKSKKASTATIADPNIAPRNRVSFTSGKQIGPLARSPSARTGFIPEVRRGIRMIETTAVVIASITGIICGLISIWFEKIVADHVDNSSSVYYVYIVLINVFVSIIEVNGMYATAVLCAFRLTVCTGLRLYPQDAEREFLTRAIARAALQVGHRKERLFGMDPMRGSPRIILAMSFLMYKSKRYMLKFLLKLFIKRVIWRAAAKTMLSLLVLPINGLMNAWTLRGVMRNCRVSIIGPPCATVLLERFFLQDSSFTPFQRVDYVRVMGCALVTKRCVHPNLEIMIEQMRHRWMKPTLWPVTDTCTCSVHLDEPCASHALDDTERFISNLRLYASQFLGPSGASVRHHVRNIFFLLILSLIIDGSVDWAERRLYVRACDAARMQNEWKAILRLKDEFVAGKGIHADTVYKLVHELPPEEADRVEERPGVPWIETLTYVSNRIARFFVW